jgi:hypothetical protein
LSNAAGVVTNQLTLITDQFYNTNTAEFTTNYFHAYDVPLTPGLNVLTLHATDLAGNVTTLTTNLTCSLPTTPPTVEMFLPLTGWQVSGDSLTLRGQVNDPTATVSVSMVGDDGQTTELGGLVGRDGILWVENVPLHMGRNDLELTVTSASSSTPTTIPIQVTRSTINLTINPPVNAGQAHVGGSIDPGGYRIWVNGVEATLDGSTWSVDITPIGIGGGLVEVTAIPDLDTVIPGGPGQNPDSTNALHAQVTVAAPQGVFISAYHKDYHETIYTPEDATSDLNTLDDTYAWADGQPGSSKDERLYFWENSPMAGRSTTIRWPASHWPTPLPAATVENAVFGVGITTTDQSVVPEMQREHCCYQRPVTDFNGDSGWASRTADTEVKLATGGPLGSKQMNLWCISATATDQDTELSIPPEQIQIGSFGKLDENGELWVVLPDNNDPTTITLSVSGDVPGSDNYTFSENAHRVIPNISIETADRFVHGVVQGLAVDDVGLEITGGGKSYGQYQNLFPNLRPANSGMLLPPASPQIYADESDILSESEVSAMDAGTYQYGGQEVIFVKDTSDPTKLHFYTVADNYAKLQISLMLRLRQDTAVLKFDHPVVQNGLARTEVRSENSNFSLTQTVNTPATPVNGNYDLSSLINYADIRINSAAIDAVPQVQGGGGPRTMQQRSLLTKSLLAYGKCWLHGSVLAPVTLVRGGVEGFWGGMNSDYDGVAAISTIGARFGYSTAERAAVVKEICSISISEIGNQIGNSFATIFSQAQANALMFGELAYTDTLVHIYDFGYGSGFALEQIVMLKGAGVACKAIGSVTREALTTLRGGTVVLDAVAALSRFKTQAVEWAVKRTIADALNDEVAQALINATKSMAGKVEKLPTLINCQSVGQILGKVTESLVGFYDELRLIGKPLDDFGVKAHEQLAKLLERDLGYVAGVDSISEKALAANARLCDKLVDGARYEDFIKCFTKADGTVAKVQLKASHEAYYDVTRNLAAGECPAFPVKAIDQIHEKLYHYTDAETLLSQYADGADSIWSLAAYNKGSGRYITWESHTSQSVVKDRFQLPKMQLADGTFVDDPAKGRFKFEFSSSQIADDCSIPQSYQHSVQNPGPLNKLEPVCTDNPTCGAGGGGQYTEKPALNGGTIKDLKTGQIVRDKAHLQQLITDYPD